MTLLPRFLRYPCYYGRERSRGAIVVAAVVAAVVVVVAVGLSPLRR